MSWNFLAAVKDFFDYPNIIAMKNDYVKLTPDDKKEIREGLIKNGYNIVVDSNLEKPVALLSTPPKKDDGPNYESPLDPVPSAIGGISESLPAEHPAVKAA